MSVIHIKDAPAGWKYNRQYVYIGRSGHGMDGYFGNPYSISPSQTRGEVIAHFREFAEGKMYHDREYRGAVVGLRNKTLVCFCKPLACHGDVLLDLAKA